MYRAYHDLTLARLVTVATFKLLIRATVTSSPLVSLIFTSMKLRLIAIIGFFCRFDLALRSLNLALIFSGNLLLLARLE